MQDYLINFFKNTNLYPEFKLKHYIVPAIMITTTEDNIKYHSKNILNRNRI